MRKILLTFVICGFCIVGASAQGQGPGQGTGNPASNGNQIASRNIGFIVNYDAAIGKGCLKDLDTGEEFDFEDELMNLSVGDEVIYVFINKGPRKTLIIVRPTN